MDRLDLNIKTDVRARVFVGEGNVAGLVFRWFVQRPDPEIVVAKPDGIVVAEVCWNTGRVLFGDLTDEQAEAIQAFVSDEVDLANEAHCEEQVYHRERWIYGDY